MRKGICPLCKKEWESEDNKSFPFCGATCKNLDLYAWFNGEYCITESLSNSCDDEEAAESVAKMS